MNIRESRLRHFYGDDWEWVRDYMDRSGRKVPPWLRSYYGMKARCENPKSPNYRYYGAAGIRVEITRHDLFQMFKRDGAEYMKRPSVDRINGHGSYTLENTRWIELSENCQRTKDRRLSWPAKGPRPCRTCKKDFDPEDIYRRFCSSKCAKVLGNRKKKIGPLARAI